MNEVNNMFYCYRQNNPDGKFVINDKVTVTVIIEADSDQDADSKAENLGISFDRLAEHYDYPTRWDSAEGYAAFADPTPFVRASKYYDKVNVPVGEAFCYVYKSDGEQVKFIREQ